MADSTQIATASPTEEAQFAALEAQVADTRAQADQRPAEHLRALTTLGQAYLKTGNAPKALTQFDEGLEVAHAQHDAQSEARFLGFQGMALRRLGNSPLARRAFSASLKLARETQQTALEIDTLVQLGQVQVEMGQSGRAIAQYETAFDLAAERGEQSRQIMIAAELGTLFATLDAPDKALEYLAIALETASAAGNIRTVCSCNLQIGEVLLSQHDHAQAQSAFEAALEQAGDLADPLMQMRALNGLMRTHAGAGRLTLALTYGDQAVGLAREHADSAREIAYISALVGLLLPAGKSGKALRYLQRGLEIAHAQDDWDWQLSMNTLLGHAYYQEEQLGDAQAAYREALTHAEFLQDQKAMAYLAGRLGAVMADQGETTAALDTTQRALEQALALEDEPLAAEQKVLLAFLHRDLGDNEQAQTLCRQALATFEATGDEEYAERARALLAELNDATTSTISNE
jgi:tetratricopeptide (TPR) repeat protein